MPWLSQYGYDFACTGFMPPNLTLFSRIDSVWPVVSWPVSPERCEVVMYRCYPEEFFEQDNFKETLEIYKNFARQIFEEDRSMLESMQKAMHSPAFSPGRLSTQEQKLHHFLNGYLDRMFGADLPKRDHT